MKWMTFKIQQEPGFRINLRDLIIIAVLIILSYTLFSITGDESISLLPLYVGLSFFLFCNVFRIGNRLEACWYIPFTLTFTSSFYFTENFWVPVLLICEPIKVLLILYRIKKGSYHGVFYKLLSKGSIL
jgi:hypothetical protein